MLVFGSSLCVSVCAILGVILCTVKLLTACVNTCMVGYDVCRQKKTQFVIIRMFHSLFCSVLDQLTTCIQGLKIEI